MSAITWPAERFFWAVLDAPGVTAGVMPAGLAATLQDEVPAAVESLHAVVTPLGGGRVLVCAAMRENLAELASDVLSLRAEMLPGSVPEMEGALAPELLVGEFEPRVLRRERGRRTAVLAASILVAAGLISTGLLRRAGALTANSNAAKQLASMVTKDATSGNAGTLDSELIRLQAIGAAGKSMSPPDAAAALASLLRSWPEGVECEANLVSVGGKSMTLSFTVKDDPRPLLASLKAPKGWVLEEPRLNSTAGVTRVTLSLKLNAEGSL